MERLLPVVNQLQHVLGVIGSHSIPLPQLVVVGSQSSGKSSVLENIVGRDFLPRGNNMVTRRPLVLQLLNSATVLGLNSSNAGSNSPGSSASTTSQDATLEWGEFSHKPGKFTDYSQIKAEIIRETERLVGQTNTVSPEPIILKLYSPNFIPLTLVDLPGIIKVATRDQPEDIDRQIRDMVLRFISHPSVIIVAVSSATEDIANSEALKIAREVDPEGLRTLGVLTKLDLMDQGTDALPIIRNEMIPLKLGYIGVISRSQKDINENKPISESLKAERLFFERGPYAQIAHQMGTSYLVRRLNTLLLAYVHRYLPSIREKVIHTLGEAEKELESYGSPLEELLADVATASGVHPTQLSDAQRRSQILGPLLLSMLSGYSTAFNELLEGRCSRPSFESSTQLWGGARISYIFHDVFGSHIDKIDPFDSITDAEIRVTIKNSSGPRSTLFMSEAAFEMILRKLVERLRAPALECVEMVVSELERVARQCETAGTASLQRFPNLQEALIRNVSEILKKRLSPTQQMVNNLINMEQAYVNTSHPDFIGASKALAYLVQSRKQQKDQQQKEQKEVSGQAPNTPSTSQSSPEPTPKSLSHSLKSGSNGVTEEDEVSAAFSRRPPSERELLEIDVVKLLISNYFSIVKKTIKDTVPKTIMFLLVNKTKQTIQSELVAQLYKEELFEPLLREADGLSKKREVCVKTVRQLRQALEILNTIKDVQL